MDEGIHPVHVQKGKGLNKIGGHQNTFGVNGRIFLHVTSQKVAFCFNCLLFSCLKLMFR